MAAVCLVAVLAFDSAALELAKVIAGLEGPPSVSQRTAIVVVVVMTLVLTGLTGWLAVPGPEQKKSFC
jgi:hypothetical protein